MIPKRENLEVLIVDDSKTDLGILESILIQIGFQNITKTKSGEEGLQWAEKFKPDLVISDIMMPGMDGCDLRVRLKENRGTRHIPVIFVSALISPEEESACQIKHGDLLIAKPFSADRISEVIDIALS